MQAFLDDNSPEAWTRVIDSLLASPHYGERWGRHWLDVARYADSDGFEQDFNRPDAWRYRDYVIASLNQDKPYTQFLKEQIAGDEIDGKSNETLIATGFLRAGPRVNFREKDNPERRWDYIDDLDRHGRPGRARPHGQLRALPQSQVRSDPAEGLLQSRRSAERVRRDRSAAGAA